VVTAVAVPEPELDEPDVAPDDDAVAPMLALDVGAVAFAADVAAAVFAAALARAGSLPVASWTKIPPEVARNVAAATAATRRRIIATLRLRTRSRSATKPVAAGGA
jgi:hypothetical protein